MTSPLNGATCPVGGKPGNRGGGRPASVVREAMREAGAARVPVLASIADGEPTVRTRVRLKDLLPHCVCPKCGDQLEARDPAGLVELEVETSANPKDRVQAVDTLLRYGLGPLRGVGEDDVRDRLAETLEIIRRECPPELADRVIALMRPVWVG